MQVCKASYYRVLKKLPTLIQSKEVPPLQTKYRITEGRKFQPRCNYKRCEKKIFFFGSNNFYFRWSLKNSWCSGWCSLLPGSQTQWLAWYRHGDCSFPCFKKFVLNLFGKIVQIMQKRDNITLWRLLINLLSLYFSLPYLVFIHCFQHSFLKSVFQIMQLNILQYIQTTNQSFQIWRCLAVNAKHHDFPSTDILITTTLIS